MEEAMQELRARVYLTDIGIHIDLPDLRYSFSLCFGCSLPIGGDYEAADDCSSNAIAEAIKERVAMPVA